MADIFGYNRNPKPAAAFSTDNSVLTLASVGNSKGDASGLLVQNWNINYQQQVQEVFELGSNNLYWVKGRPVGQGTLARIIGSKGPGVSGSLFPPDAYDVCKGGAKFDFTVGSGNCGGGTGLEFEGDKGALIEMDGCVITNVGFSADVNDTRVVENIGWRFGHLKVSDSKV
jgi:hypothetical protein